jgi:hypothetical protein
MESYGGIGTAARQLLQQLAHAGNELEAKSFLVDAFIRLSVELQRGNAIIHQRGMQQIEVDQLELAGGGTDGAMIGGSPLRRASRRRQQRHQLFQHGRNIPGFDSIYYRNLRAGGGQQGSYNYRQSHISSSMMMRTSAISA